MTIEFAFDSDTNRLGIRGEFTIYHANAALLELRGRPGASLDLSEVSEMDGAGLQLLMAARRDADMRVVAASDAVTEVLELAGQARLLEV